MCNMVKSILKPFFDRVSQIGISAPHDGYETELMLAGIKPCMITGWLHPDQRLQHALNQDRLVLSGIHTVSFPKYILCTTDVAKDVARYAVIERKIADSEKLDNDDIAGRVAFLENHCGILFDIDPSLDSTNNFQRRFTAGDLIGAECDLLRKGTIQATLPLMTGTNHSHTHLPLDIGAKIETGVLSAILVHTRTEDSAVLAQPACAEMGQELFARYFQNEEGYPPLSGTADFTRRIGYLLGYTDADTTFFLTTGNKFTADFTLKEKFHVTALPFLRYCRAQSLLLNNTPLHQPRIP